MRKYILLGVLPLFLFAETFNYNCDGCFSSHSQEVPDEVGLTGNFNEMIDGGIVYDLDINDVEDYSFHYLSENNKEFLIEAYSSYEEDIKKMVLFVSKSNQKINKVVKFSQNGEKEEFDLSKPLRERTYYSWQVKKNLFTSVKTQSLYKRIINERYIVKSFNEGRS